MGKVGCGLGLKFSKKELENLYFKKGLSLSRIARKFDCTEPNMVYWFKKLGIERRPAYFRKVDIPRDVLESLYWKHNISSSEIGKKFGINGRTVRKKLKKFGITSKTVSEANTKHSKTSFSGDLKMKSYLLGLRTGDFHARRVSKMIRVQTTTTHPAQLSMMVKVFEQYSHVRKYEFFNKNFNAHQWFIYCDLNESFAFMLEKPSEMPKWILSDEKLFYCFVAGYSDCESCWKILKSHENAIRFVFQLSSQDKEILNQITRKMKSNGYTPNLYLDTKAGITRQGRKNNKDMYRIMIYRTEDIMKLIQVLLPLSKHQEKIDKMNLIFRNKDKKWLEVKDEWIELRNKIKNGRLQNTKLQQQ